MKKIEVYVATHKEYIFSENHIYKPIHVGKELSSIELNILSDNVGDNISRLNKSFCELTALYWMWKNSDADILGLVHYRRYFYGTFRFNKGYIFDATDLKFFNGINVIVAIKEKFYKKTTRKFFIRTKEYYSVEEQFSLNHFSKDWSKLREVIFMISSEYIESFDYVSKSTSGISLYNMFIADKEFVNMYSEWLFSILFFMSDHVDLSEYDQYQSRLLGFLSERLLNVFIYHHRNDLNIYYRDIVMFD
ncbi:DUF4422 domain-containing protein [Acinetobacter johnsonii]|uniref:DUF4422 domain-containing protein n=1 Tax=Acinetobacter johnsonii TaxID=40214 RepID=UPI001F43E407|nr:DUF4422 domain-containing protein [Acinetobacter johnsonii]UIZ98881.1 DUF4422 domain-containing protein [Acinetobacter johnsonii]